MKSATLFLVSVLIFVFTSPSLSTSILTADGGVVLDSLGDPLEKDAAYIISPPLWGPLGGPLKLETPAGNVNETCEADVVQIPGLVVGAVPTPFTITPANPSEDSIQLGSPVAIQSPANPCGETHSTVWKVSSREGLLPTIITTGGTSNTGPSCFRIVKAERPFIANSYEFEHCPYLCGGAKICRRLGVFTSENYVTYLSSNGLNPFQFIFIKNTESAAN